jgi:hypothetical protein
LNKMLQPALAAHDPMALFGDRKPFTVLAFLGLFHLILEPFLQPPNECTGPAFQIPIAIGLVRIGQLIALAVVCAIPQNERFKGLGQLIG